jgi:hypothetical protein
MTMAATKDFNNNNSAELHMNLETTRLRGTPKKRQIARQAGRYTDRQVSRYVGRQTDSNIWNEPAAFTFRGLVYQAT